MTQDQAVLGSEEVVFEVQFDLEKDKDASFKDYLASSVGSGAADL